MASAAALPARPIPGDDHVSDSSAALNLLQVDTETRWGGGQQQVQHLCQGLVAGGHRVTLVCHRDGILRHRMKQAPVTVLTLPSFGEVDPRGILGLARIISRGRFDLMHMHSSRAHTMGALAAALVRFRPRVVSRRSRHSTRRDPINRWKYGSGIDRVVAISRAVRRSLLESGFDPEDVDLVPSGIDPPRRRDGARKAVIAEFGLPADAELAVCVANLVALKGHRTLIRAVALLAGRRPALRVILAGGGPLLGDLEGAARSAGVKKHILFCGFRNDIDRLLSAADLSVCPSLSEGLGLSILDALAMELPVAASDVGGIPEIISHEETGLLVPPGDPAALAEAMERLLDDRDTATRLGRAGRKIVLEKYSVKAMVQGTEAVYRRVLNQAG